MTDLTFRSDIKVTLVDVMGEDVDVARAAWVSTKGARAEDEQDGDKVGGLIRYLMKGRHGSPFEHCLMKWVVEAPIFVWREHHRHRIASYNEQSGRYGVLPPSFYIPDESRNLVQEGKPGEYVFVAGTPEQSNIVGANVRGANQQAYAAYEDMLLNGVAPEVARVCLPVNIYSTCYVTMNLRALMNFLSLRTKDPESLFPSFPQREIEMLAEQYEQGFRAQFPKVWEAFHSNGRVAP